MGGEPLGAAAVGPLGVEGDRVLAVRDEQGEITWAGAVPELMQVRAVLAGAGVADLTLPDGQRFRSDAADADRLLTAAVHAPVTLVPHRPDNPDAAVHLLTTTALRSLGRALPGSTIDATRFRPNLVLDDAPGRPYPEQTWIGRRLAVGALRLRVTQPCDRCVMTTKQTPTAPHDKAVLRHIARNLANAFGVYAAIEVPGEVRTGDEARWLD